MKSSENKMASLVSILFSAPGPVKRVPLCKHLNMDDLLLSKSVDQAIKILEPLGLTISSDTSQLELATTAEVSDQIKSFLGKQTTQLSQANMEVLAIVAYNQPVTRDAIDEIRGIASEQTLRNLTNKNLIKRNISTAPTKTTYSTTLAFLHTLGIKSIKDLPPTNVTFKD